MERWGAEEAAGAEGGGIAPTGDNATQGQRQATSEPSREETSEVERADGSTATTLPPGPDAWDVVQRAAASPALLWRGLAAVMTGVAVALILSALGLFAATRALHAGAGDAAGVLTSGAGVTPALAAVSAAAGAVGWLVAAWLVPARNQAAASEADVRDLILLVEMLGRRVGALEEALEGMSSSGREGDAKVAGGEGAGLGEGRSGGGARGTACARGERGVGVLLHPRKCQTCGIVRHVVLADPGYARPEVVPDLRYFQPRVEVG